MAEKLEPNFHNDSQSDSNKNVESSTNFQVIKDNSETQSNYSPEGIEMDLSSSKNEEGKDNKKEDQKEEGTNKESEKESKEETKTESEENESKEEKNETENNKKEKEGENKQMTGEEWFGNKKKLQENEGYEKDYDMASALGIEKETSEILGDYKKKNNLELDQREKENITNALKEEGKDSLSDIAEAYLRDHKKELEEQGLKDLSNEHPLLLFSKLMESKYGPDWESRFFKDAIKSGGEYGEKTREYMYLFETRKSFESRPDNINNQYASLYFINKRTHRIEGKELEAEKNTSRKEDKETQEKEINKLKSQLSDLFQMELSLYRGMTGEDITEEVKKEMPEEKFDYRTKIKSFRQERVDGKVKELEKEIKDIPLSDKINKVGWKLGYNIETERKLFGRYAKLVNAKKESVNWPNTKQKMHHLNGSAYRILFDEYKKRLKWEEGVKDLSEQRVKEKLNGMFESFEKSKEKVHSIFEKIRNQTIIDWAEEDLKKNRDLSEEEMEKFNHSGKSPHEFIGEIDQKEKDVQGNWKKDGREIINLCNEFGADINTDKILQDQTFAEHYENLFRNGKIVHRIDFIKFILDLIFFGYANQEKEK